VITGIPRLTGPLGWRSRVRSRLTSFREAVSRLTFKPSTSPAVELGFADSVSQISDDLHEPWASGGRQPKTRASYARVFVFAGRALGTSAFTEFQLVCLEVRLEGIVRLTGLGCSVVWCGWGQTGYVDATLSSLYKGHRYPAEIISHCVWLYHRFPLSLREVEEMMMARGVLVTYETIHQWCRKFGSSRDTCDCGNESILNGAELRECGQERGSVRS
jgi:hypothetical protein